MSIVRGADNAHGVRAVSQAVGDRLDETPQRDRSAPPCSPTARTVHLVKIGETVGGYSVVEITEDTVTLADARRRALESLQVQVGGDGMPRRLATLHPVHSRTAHA